MSMSVAKNRNELKKARQQRKAIQHEALYSSGVKIYSPKSKRKLTKSSNFLHQKKVNHPAPLSKKGKPLARVSKKPRM